MVAGPGAAYICDACLELCQEIINDPAPFSPKALELAARPPVVIAAPPALNLDVPAPQKSAKRTLSLDLEQKQQGITLMLYEMKIYEHLFEIHYVWMRPPLPKGFAFMPRLLFAIRDDTGEQWAGDRGGNMRARPELASDPGLAVYQGNVRFRPPPSTNSRKLTIKVADPLSALEEEPAQPWSFEVHL